MISPLVALCLIVGLSSSGARKPAKYTLCTFDSVSSDKCLAVVKASRDANRASPLQCVSRRSRTDCLQTVKNEDNHYVVLDQHDYMAAREAGLSPIIFAREERENFIIAVTARNISLIEYNEATLNLDTSDERAFHSALAFNALRGRNICPDSPSIAQRRSIRILNSDQYKPLNSSEDILLCPFATYAETNAFASCNYDAGLQNAVFVYQKRGFKPRKVKELRRQLLDLLHNFNGYQFFNFFDTFQSVNDVIFKNNTIGFDLRPSYVNGIDESVFSELHCNESDHKDHPGQLGDDLETTK
ncbi:uncharacterized protein LOC111064710 [Drosophila obscura]|uniref:uncharacterized protein LOC111064710 n=1 Tax=Drosophila obscura TaxID=7282 RepID=UPI000B9FAC58|nr:uncharacterized protein LOC111064710 [Drosophila obscura]XP_022208157.1 uncharacterized protein LOC111064710 [Drosophila obscura]XP_022208158.1 uncharacterized protein LOC111064710 [Drosophila obscura]